MTQEEFISILDKERYSYEIEGDKIVVTHDRDVGLGRLTSIPPGVVFRNKRFIYLDSITSLPSGVEFENRGSVDLRSLTSLPPGVEFKNEGVVYLESLIGGYFDDWKGNIEGIDHKRLLNFMINKGVFER